MGDDDFGEDENPLLTTLVAHELLIRQLLALVLTPLSSSEAKDVRAAIIEAAALWHVRPGDPPVDATGQQRQAAMTQREVRRIVEAATPRALRL